MVTLTQEMVALMEDNLIPNSSFDEAKAVYHDMLGDCFKTQIDLQQQQDKDDRKPELVQRALASYREAHRLLLSLSSSSSSSEWMTSPRRQVSCARKLCAFYQDYLDDSRQAATVAESTIKAISQSIVVHQQQQQDETSTTKKARQSLKMQRFLQTIVKDNLYAYCRSSNNKPDFVNQE